MRLIILVLFLFLCGCTVEKQEDIVDFSIFVEDTTCTPTCTHIPTSTPTPTSIPMNTIEVTILSETSCSSRDAYYDNRVTISDNAKLVTFGIDLSGTNSFNFIQPVLEQNGNYFEGDYQGFEFYNDDETYLIQVIRYPIDIDLSDFNIQIKYKEGGIIKYCSADNLVVSNIDSIVDKYTNLVKLDRYYIVEQLQGRNEVVEYDESVKTWEDGFILVPIEGTLQRTLDIKDFSYMLDFDEVDVSLMQNFGSWYKDKIENYKLRNSALIFTFSNTKVTDFNNIYDKFTFYYKEFEIKNLRLE